MDIMRLLTGDWGALGASLLGSLQYGEDVEEYNKKNKELQELIESIYGTPTDPGVQRNRLQNIGEANVDRTRREGSRLRRGYDQRTQDVLAELDRSLEGTGLGYGQLQDALAGSEADLGKGYDEARLRALGYLEGAGQQQEADIKERFTGRESQIMADLASRGLGGTTVAPSMQLGVEREQSGELRRLADDLRQQYLETDKAYSLPALSAKERLKMAQAAAMEGGLQAGERGRNIRVGTHAGLTEDALSADERFTQGLLAAQNQAKMAPWMFDESNRQELADFYRHDVEYLPPSANNFFNNWAGYAAATPEPLPKPKWYESLLGGASQGVGQGAGMGIGARMFGQNSFNPFNPGW